MQSYHKPLIGFIISKDSNNDYFSKTLNALCRTDDLSIDCLTSENFLNYIKDDDYVDCSLDIDYDRATLMDFFDWLKENEKLFKFIYAYHGGAMNTPVALVLKESSSYHYDEYSSYTTSIEDIEKMVKEAKFHRDLCKKTMPNTLFTYFEDRGEFGVQYFSCST